MPPRAWRTPSELWVRLKPLAQQMRRAPTPAEDDLWRRLRNRQLDGLKFRRQHSVGQFIVDFYCAEARLVVEVDGSSHDASADQDAMREEFLAQRGLRVLRFRNDAVHEDPDSVRRTIAAACREAVDRGRQQDREA